MKSSPRVVAAVLAGLAVSAFAQVADGTVRKSAPPTIYSSSSSSAASAAVRPPPVQPAPAVPRTAARSPMFAAGSVPTVARLSTDSREERRFLRDAAAESRFELDASRLAASKSASSAVRSLAASLVNHHNNLTLELTHLLNARGMALPMLGNDQRKALNRLAKLSGRRFDVAYIQQVGLAQAGVARDFEKASLTIREPQVNAWIVKTLPTTRYHLLLAERAERAAPAAPRPAKWNHPAGRGTVVRAPTPTPVSQAQPAAVADRDLLASSRAGVHPVAATRDRLSVSGNR